MAVTPSLPQPHRPPLLHPHHPRRPAHGELPVIPRLRQHQLHRQILPQPAPRTRKRRQERVAARVEQRHQSPPRRRPGSVARNRISRRQWLQRSTTSWPRAAAPRLAPAPPPLHPSAPPPLRPTPISSPPPTPTPPAATPAANRSHLHPATRLPIADCRLPPRLPRPPIAHRHPRMPQHPPHPSRSHPCACCPPPSSPSASQPPPPPKPTGPPMAAFRARAARTKRPSLTSGNP